MSTNQGDATRIFIEIMQRCKIERKANSTFSSKDLAKALEITPGYMSALENGRVLPSIELFLKYLMLAHFDLSPLSQLAIKTGGSRLSKLREELAHKTSAMNEEQLEFLLEQAKVVKILQTKKTRRDKEKSQ